MKAAWLLGVAALQAAGAHESLQMHGMAYPSSCAPPAWRTLSDALSQAAGKRQPEVLQALARTLLCDDDPQARERLLRAAPARVVVVKEGTGERPLRRQRPAAEVLEPRSGQAWNATVQGTAPSVTLSFFENEACLRSVELRLGSKGWSITRVGQACD